MAINVYRAFTNPLSGETYECLKIDDEAYTMRWSLKPRGYVPFEHIHLEQDEILEVKKGELRVDINGLQHIAKPGESIRVPKGQRHIALNNQDTEMEALVTYIPALDQSTFFQCFLGLIEDGYMDKKGGINIPMMGYCLRKMKCRAMARPTNIPAPLFNLSLNMFSLLGTLLGWKKLYNKYTQP